MLDIKTLKVNDKVCTPSSLGGVWVYKVTSIHQNYVSIQWDNRQYEKPIWAATEINFNNAIHWEKF